MLAPRGRKAFWCRAAGPCWSIDSPVIIPYTGGGGGVSLRRRAAMRREGTAVRKRELVKSRRKRVGFLGNTAAGTHRRYRRRCRLGDISTPARSEENGASFSLPSDRTLGDEQIGGLLMANLLPLLSLAHKNKVEADYFVANCFHWVQCIVSLTPLLALS